MVLLIAAGSYKAAKHRSRSEPPLQTGCPSSQHLSVSGPAAENPTVSAAVKFASFLSHEHQEKARVTANPILG